MTIQQLANYIKKHKSANVPHPYGDEFTIAHHTRSILFQHVHITNEHILECCATASSYDEFIELCRPLAIADTEAFPLERNKPTPNGRTRRRFR